MQLRIEDTFRNPEISVSHTFQAKFQDKACCKFFGFKLKNHMGRMGGEKRTMLIDDDRAFALLQSVSQNPSAHVQARMLADFSIAKMCCQGRTRLITDDHAFALLQNICANPSAIDQNIKKANYFKARMRYENKTNLVTDDEAFAIFQGLSQDAAVMGRTLCAAADFYMAGMRCQNRTHLMSRS